MKNKVLFNKPYVSKIDKKNINKVFKNGKFTEPRKLHCTQWGVICPFETPEGSSIGIVKNMALMSNITIPCSTDTIISCLEENDVIELEEVNPVDIFDSVKVFIASFTAPEFSRVGKGTGVGVVPVLVVTVTVTPLSLVVGVLSVKLTFVIVLSLAIALITCGLLIILSTINALLFS